MTTTASHAADVQPSEEPIVARGATYYRVTRFLFAAVLLGFGVAFAYDGFYRYPLHNELHLQHARDPKNHPQDYATHNAPSIQLQKILAVAMPLAAVGLLGWTLYSSRGAYRLADDVLSVPGHPDVPLTGITKIDKTRWDRKGIVCLDYELPSGQRGTVTLDDFIYHRPPTDRILEQIEAKLGVEMVSQSAPQDLGPQ